MTMDAERLKQFEEKYADRSREELLDIIMGLTDELTQAKAHIAESNKIEQTMVAECQKLENENAALRKENMELQVTLLHVIDINKLQTKEIFGRGTEKTADVLDAVPIQEETDEATVDDVPNAEENKGKTPKEGKNAGQGNGNGRKRSNGWQKGDFSDLPHHSIFLLDIEELNRMYGPFNWRIYGWNLHSALEHVPESVYVNDFYTPVISVGLEHHLVTINYEPPLWLRSFATPSILAWTMYLKYVMALPVYRIAKLFKDLGVSLSRQLLSNWSLRAAEEFFRPIYEYLKAQLLTVPYQQCDETTIQVINDGRRAGRQSYFWVHATSELAGTFPIILFCFELTRSTEHLRQFYEDFQGYITCDAYCSYQTLESEKLGVIIVCGCMMHLRRRFVQSLDLIDLSMLDEETKAELPEAKALHYIQDIYNANEPLKTLTAEERQARRDQDVRPLVEAFYNYIESLDINDPLMGERLKDAIQYALNQKEHIIRFLEDAHIPLDNGAIERAIRPLTLLRASSLFCDSVSGAKAIEVMCTIVETA
ncbi:MAG: IS66 family transposase, partial [Clostridiales bacterium]|nr:IS66 family transposase [Clostridiales bacterium]